MKDAADASVERLFGTHGAMFYRLVRELLSDLKSAQYHFMGTDVFTQLPHADLVRVYWTEILYRAHWAAASNILRHERWMRACVNQYQNTPNYLGFAAALRGMVESAADAFHDLANVPLTLARARAHICMCLAGRSTRMSVCKDIEEQLIHFQFARRLGRGDLAPEVHRALPTKAYIAAADGPDTVLANLYSELCQLAHPGAESILWFAEQDGEAVTLTLGEDGAWIESLVQRHAQAIEISLMQGVNSSLLTFKLLNRFEVPSVHVRVVDGWSAEGIPGWRKVEEAWRGSRLDA